MPDGKTTVKTALRSENIKKTIEIGKDSNAQALLEQFGLKDLVTLSKSDFRLQYYKDEVDSDDKKFIENYNKYDFASAMSDIMTFMSSDLSAFYLDIAKDTLYCDKKDSIRRNQMQSVIYTVGDTLLRLLNPILPFTMDEFNEFFNKEVISKIRAAENCKLDTTVKDKVLTEPVSDTVELYTPLVKVVQLSEDSVTLEITKSDGSRLPDNGILQLIILSKPTDKDDIEFIDVENEEKKEGEEEKTEKPVNDPSPLWLKNPSECTEEEYKEYEEYRNYSDSDSYRSLPGKTYSFKVQDENTIFYQEKITEGSYLVNIFRRY